MAVGEFTGDSEQGEKAEKFIATNHMQHQRNPSFTTSAANPQHHLKRGVLATARLDAGNNVNGLIG